MLLEMFFNNFVKNAKFLKPCSDTSYWLIFLVEEPLIATVIANDDLICSEEIQVFGKKNPTMIHIKYYVNII